MRIGGSADFGTGSGENYGLVVVVEFIQLCGRKTK